jgi:hypothetical protein
MNGAVALTVYLRFGLNVFLDDSFDNRVSKDFQPSTSVA